MLKGFAIGFVVALLLLVGGFASYFVSGMAPAATADPPMPFEKRLARLALNAHIDKQDVKESPLPADEPNLRAGAQVYKDHCAVCHGLPAEPAPATADQMYPPATQLFKGKGVTDDPAFESYWKTTNGIRLTGMPAFKAILTDGQRWQVSQLVAHANEIPGAVKTLLMRNETQAAQDTSAVLPPVAK